MVISIRFYCINRERETHINGYSTHGKSVLKLLIHWSITSTQHIHIDSFSTSQERASMSFQWKSRFLSQALDVVLPSWMIILWPVIRCPHRLSYKQPHQLHITQHMKSNHYLFGSQVQTRWYKRKVGLFDDLD